MYDILRRKHNGLKDDAVRFAQKLVRIPSVSLNEGDVAAAIEEKLTELGYAPVFRDDTGNVIGILAGREAEPTVLLNSHMDTVPPSEGDAWKGSPHDGRIEAGTLHGLGAADCKGGIAAQAFAGALLKRSLLPLKGNLIFAATVAEENGRSVGVRALVEQTLPDLNLKPTYAILGEPTDLGLYYGHDGWAEFDIRVEGANPFHVDDAAKAVFDDLLTANQRMRITEPPEAITVRRPHFQDLEGIRRATIQVDRRLRLAEDAPEILMEMKHAASRAVQSKGAVAVDVLVRQENQRLYTGRATMVQNITHAWATDPFHPLMERARQALAAAGCEVRPGKWRLGRLGMGTAGSALTGTFDIPAIGYGPGHEEQAHACGESVEVAKVAEAVYGTAAIAHSLVGVPVFGWASDEI